MAAAAAAPTSMPQAAPSSDIVGTQRKGTRRSRHLSSRGWVMAGSAFSARQTNLAWPRSRALRSCFAPTTTLFFFNSAKSPHLGILQSFLVSIQKLIIRRFFKMSTKTFQKFRFFCPLLHHVANFRLSLCCGTSRRERCPQRSGREAAFFCIMERLWGHRTPIIVTER